MNDLQALTGGNYNLRLPLQTLALRRGLPITIDVGPDEITEWCIALALLLVREMTTVAVTQRVAEQGRAPCTLGLRLSAGERALRPADTAGDAGVYGGGHV